MNVFAKFDEIPPMLLQDIKETKRYGHTFVRSDGRTDGQCENSLQGYNYDGLESPMLHTKFRGNRSTGSGEEDFLMVCTIYGRGGHLGHVTQMPRTNFRSPYHRRLHIKFGFDWPSAFRGDDI